MRKRMTRWLAILCLLLDLTAGSGTAQLLVPKRVQQFDDQSGLSLSALGMVQDDRGRLWLASTNGIVYFDGRQFGVLHDPLLKEGDYYYHLIPSPDGRIWLKMGWGYSLSYVDPRQPRLVRISDTTRLVRNYLAKYGSHSMLADAQANLWIGLQGHGLLKVDARTLAVEHIVDRGLHVRFITQDRRGQVYFTTGDQGLFVYNPQTKKLTNYRHNAKDRTSLSSDATYGVQARPDGTILVGLNNGANLFNPTTGQFQNLRLNTPRTADPDLSAYIKEFKLDARGNAYFSQGTIIYRYTAQGTLQQVGVRSPTHTIRSLFVSPANRLWISSSNTLAEYDLQQARIVPSLLFLKLTINGTNLRDNTSSTQNLVYDAQGHPTLTVRENDPFTMQFTLAAKLGPEMLRWRLDGYDSAWRIASQDIQGEAAYQLPAGRYTFTTNRGVRTAGWAPTVSTLTIVVVAPFWKTPSFLILLGLAVGGLGYYQIRMYTRRRQLARQLAHEQAEATSLRQLDELKTRFFSNITHEFRTPLTIILNATEQLTAKDPKPHEGTELATIQRHAHQLLRLITETLDIARLEAGRLEAHPQLGHPVWFIGQVVAQFAGLAAQRGITLTYNSHSAPDQELAPDDSPNGTLQNDALFSFDGEKWEKIAYNLLANALKFTPYGGRVLVTGYIQAGNRFVLVVQDTGIGIAGDQQERIFERFYQVDDGSTRAYSGTGIGLALVRDLTTWLGGQVRVVSQSGQGSTFTVELPLTAPNPAPASAPSMSQPPLGQVPFPLSRSVANTTAESTGAESTGAESTAAMPKPLVLVVEDNEDLRAQVVNYLAEHYQVLSAENGRLGWEQALRAVPDLIVSDVMMPDLDGYTLLAQVKNDERTSHIPVILLTARSAVESRMQGLHLGADEYLVKPFSLAELGLRIGNWLRTRQREQRRLLAHLELPPAQVPTEPVQNREEVFVHRLHQAILLQLDNNALDVDWLAEQANMSRTQLNRKLTALTGLSPNRFIQRVRLERGAELLQIGTLNVTEVAYQVGYQSPSHFAKVYS